ncbi:MAG: DUF1611 domain-containing protein [Candidatus Obscuribacterales bacterium]|nr:DUF1611 domain-containing protein [Candidatus Obscuribacterales bacterium]
MYYSQTARLAVYAQGEFHKGKSKTAEGVIRYAPNPIVAVIDSTQTGKRVCDVIPDIKCDAPLVSSIDDALQFKPDALLLGTAWAGGGMPAQWKPDIIEALEGGMDVINGLHDFLCDDPQIAATAARCGRKLLDVRKPPNDLPVASKRVLESCNAHVVLTVGSDCSVGKMTASLEIQKSAVRRKINAGFVATGQTGIMICGSGIAVDRVIGDFMAGAVEQMVVESGKNHDIVLVEGQGSLVHPGFSGVTLALLHGACPHAMILCHKATRKCTISTEHPLPPLPAFVPLYEQMASWMRPAKVIAIAVNTVGLTEEEAGAYVDDMSRQTGLPCCDPVRHGADILLDAILTNQEKTR